MKYLKIGIFLFCFFLGCSQALAETAQTSEVDRLKRVRDMVSTAQQEEGSTASKWMQNSHGEQSDLSASRVLQALALCLGVFFIFVACVKRWNRGVYAPVEKKLEILERVALGQKASLVRARYNQKELLLAVGGDDIKLLTTSIFSQSPAREHLFEEELRQSTILETTNGFKDEDPCEVDVTLSA